MIRKNRKVLILSSLVTLLPILVGLILWDRLPDKLATHWGIDGQPDGWSGLPFAVFGTPLTLLAVQWLLVLITSFDSKARERNIKPFQMVLWIMPILSNLSSFTMYALALGVEFSMSRLMLVFMGLLFLVIGNYLPKCRQNYTIGIRVPWTYADEETWNATHRFGGRVWVVCSVVMILSVFLPAAWGITVFVTATIALGVVPIVYAWLFYRKKKRSGAAMSSTLPPLKKGSKALAIGVLVFVLVLTAFIVSMLFLGDISVEYGQDSFTIVASFYDDLTVNYDSVETIEYRDGNLPGVRTWGYGSFRLLMGYFENDEFGGYTRYTYYDPESCVILTVDGKTLALSGENPEQTKTIYETLKSHTGL